jgi:hypothetical protein
MAAVPDTEIMAYETLEARLVPGEHYSVLRAPYVQALAQAMRADLRAAAL